MMEVSTFEFESEDTSRQVESPKCYVTKRKNKARNEACASSTVRIFVRSNRDNIRSRFCVLTYQCSYKKVCQILKSGVTTIALIVIIIVSE